MAEHKMRISRGMNGRFYARCTCGWSTSGQTKAEVAARTQRHINTTKWF